MQDKFKSLIAAEFRNCVDATINRICQNTPTHRPFHTALLSDEVIFWSSFERSFSTSFGQRVIEEIAKIVALANGATEAQRQKETIVDIDQSYLNSITGYLQLLREGHRELRGWDNALSVLNEASLTNDIVRRRVISDLWWRKDGVDNYISLKTVKPNIDQTTVAKEDCMILKVAQPNCNVYFGLPYNPFGNNKEDYSHNPPMGIFDFKHDSVVLIGKEMWDTIGGSGCYEEILEIAKNVGKETRDSIKAMRR